MNLLPNHHQKQINLEFGKSGGSTVQSFDIHGSRRGLGKEQNNPDQIDNCLMDKCLMDKRLIDKRQMDQRQTDPLVLWWVRKLKPEYSADGTINISYRRSRWGRAPEKKVSPIQPFLALHKEWRSASRIVLMAASLIASLNMVAQAETIAHDAVSQRISPLEIRAAERFSMMKDFVGLHNQCLDLSKLNEFKWSEETKIAAGGSVAKPQNMSIYTSKTGDADAQPQVVQSKGQTDPSRRLRSEAAPGANILFRKNKKERSLRQCKDLPRNERRNVLLDLQD
ncbi:MAG TPA: hypothetical protein PKZ32_03510 [Candidatus Melainabacteria bacterium]|nr:hypothetical protein [Candidatus Melainabacteria bacterium]